MRPPLGDNRLKKLTLHRRNIFFAVFLLSHSVTKCWNTKVAKFCKSCPKSIRITFTEKGHFSGFPKNQQIFGYTFVRNLLARSFKIAQPGHIVFKRLLIHGAGSNRWRAWSSGCGRLLMFERSWVQIPAPYTGWT